MTEDVLVVDVTAEDIARGEREQSQRCPVALALLRTQGFIWVVGALSAYGMNGAYKAWGLTTFVRRFDAGKPVEPRTFRFRRIR